MPVVIFILIVLLVAHIGFWDSLTTILGALGVMLALFLILALLIVAAATYLWRRVSGRT